MTLCYHYKCLQLLNETGRSQKEMNKNKVLLLSPLVKFWWTMKQNHNENYSHWNISRRRTISCISSWPYKLRCQHFLNWKGSVWRQRRNKTKGNKVLSAGPAATVTINLKFNFIWTEKVWQASRANNNTCLLISFLILRNRPNSTQNRQTK